MLSGSNRPFSITISAQSPGSVTFVIKGDLDEDTVPETQRFIDTHIDSTTREVVFDLAEVSFMVSCGIHLMVNLTQLLSARSGKIKLLNPQPNIRRIFRLTRLDRAIDILPEDDAGAATP